MLSLLSFKRKTVTNLHLFSSLWLSLSLFVVLAMRGRPWVSGLIFSGGSQSLVASFVPVLVFFRE
jgi:hypothetical protein